MDSKKRIIIDCLVLLACLAALSWGCWNLPVPRADETGYIAQAWRIAHGETSSFNTFFLFYAAILRFIAPDPMVAHLVARLICSVFSTYVLYFVLRAFRPWLSANAILISVVIWTSSYLCTPFAQMGTISLFGYSLGMLGIGFLMRGLTLSNFLLCEAFLFLGAQARKELWVPLLLVGLLFVAGLVLNRTVRGRVFQQLSSPLVLGLLAVVLILGGIFAVRKAETLGNSGSRSLLAFGQSYARFASQTNRERGFDPMTEYAEVLNRRFHNPKSVLDVIKADPMEAGRFFVINSFTNLTQLPVCFFSTRDTGMNAGWLQRPQAIVLILSLVVGSILGLITLISTRRQWLVPPAPLLYRLLCLLILATTSLVAFVMVTYVSRHYIPLVPLAFLFLAWCWHSLLTVPVLARIPGAAVVAVVAILFCRPGLAPAQDWNEDFRVLREARDRLPAQPLVAGIYSHPYIIYSFYGEGSQATPMTTPPVNADALLRGDYDVFIVNNNIRGTRVWKKQQPLFEAFMQTPEKWGYFLYRDIRHGGCLIYLKQKQAAL